MELRHLRYFLALAEVLSFTRAAAAVHVTQSTLSHQISQLEDELGQLLFDRSERRVTMTAAGELFPPKAVMALAEIDSGIALMRTSTRTLSGRLAIGTTPTLNLGFVPHCISIFVRGHPSMYVLVDENTGDELIADMRADKLELVIAYKPFNLEGLLFEPLVTEEMVLVVGARHPLANRRRVRMVELHRRELVLPPRKFTTRQQLDEAFQAAGAEPSVGVECSSIAGILALVARTSFATIVSRSALPVQTDQLRAIALEGPSLVRTPGLIWAVERERSPAVASFASIARTVAKSPRLMSAIERGPGAGSA